MSHPETALGWLNAAGLFWQLVAYLGAALAGLRLFSELKSEGAPRPFCVIAAVTRCLLSLRAQGQRVDASDMLRFGGLALAALCLAMAGNTAFYLLHADWRDLGALQSLLWVLGHIGVGSGLMVALTGAHRLIVEGRDHGA
jgi:hypothetical protein